MKKNKLNRFLVVALAAGMCLVGPSGVVMGAAYTPSDSAVALDTINMNEKGNLHIYKYDQTAGNITPTDGNGERNQAFETAQSNFALEGVTFKIIKLGDIVTVSNGGDVQVEYTVNANVAGLLGLTGTQFTSDELNTAMASKVQVLSSKNAIEDYAIDAAGKEATTGENGAASFSDLDLGLYLVAETAVPEGITTTTNPFLVSLPMTSADGTQWNYDVYVYPKNQSNHPVIDKVVKNAEDGEYLDTASVMGGKEAEFKVITTIPRVTTNATNFTEFSFVDTLCAGLTYTGVEDVTMGIYASEEDAKSGTDVVATLENTVDVRYSIDNDANTLAVAFEDIGLKKLNDNSEKYLCLYYKASVDSDNTIVVGDTGNKNDVELTYRRTNEAYSQTIEDRAYVFTYGINLAKSFSDDAGDPTKVKFKLHYNGLVDRDANYLILTGSDGVYYVKNSTDEYASATEVSPNADGLLKIYGLADGTYTLSETATDGDYSLLKDDISFEITATERTVNASIAAETGGTATALVDTLVSGASADVDGKDAIMIADSGSDNALIDMSIVNTKSFLLPQTGGLGTILFTLAGAGVVAVGIIIILKGKKKREAK